MLYSPENNRKQSLIHDTESSGDIMPTPLPLKYGIIYDVSTLDNVSISQPGSTLPNFPGAYLVYTVKLTPNGVFLRNVPAMMTGGHVQSNFNAPNASPLPQQNTEETPFVIGQPVIIGFVNNSNFNPIILGPVACQMNASTSSATGAAPFPLAPQTSEIYPQKQGIFQGTEWSIDKAGNTTLNIAAKSQFTLQIGGTTIVTAKPSSDSDGYELDFGLSGDTEPTILGNALVTYLNTLVTAFNNHTHISAVSGSPTSAPGTSTPPESFTNPPTSGSTTVLTEITKVQ
jgi:hypothetical protein